MDTLNQSLGLHQELIVIYVVDKYQATLYNEDGSIVAEDTGISIYDALDNLDMTLHNKVYGKINNQ